MGVYGGPASPRRPAAASPVRSLPWPWPWRRPDPTRRCGPWPSHGRRYARLATHPRHRSTGRDQAIRHYRTHRLRVTIHSRPGEVESGSLLRETDCRARTNREVPRSLRRNHEDLGVLEDRKIPPGPALPTRPIRRSSEGIHEASPCRFCSRSTTRIRRGTCGRSQTGQAIALGWNVAGEVAIERHA